MRSHFSLLYIQPGKPNQNAFIERFNRSFREEVLDANLCNTLSEVQSIADAWLSDYNECRPHESLGNVPPIEFMQQIEKLEKEMSQVQESYTLAEENYGSDLLNLVVAKGYLTKLLANEAVKSYIGRHESEILTQLELVANTVSMGEAVQQQQEAEA